MDNSLQFIPLTSPADTDWNEAMELYRLAFPPRERRSAEQHLRALADPRFHAEAIRCEGLFAGILFWWQGPAFRFVEHLAVSPALRGRNLGSRVLEAFCRDARTVLEIEPPEDAISCRRREFYRRLGFVENPQEYIHPSYCRPFEAHRLVLMSRPGPLTREEARAFADFVREVVLRYTEHDRPTQPRIA